jgi:hypothetical protein
MVLTKPALINGFDVVWYALLAKLYRGCDDIFINLLDTGKFMTKKENKIFFKKIIDNIGIISILSSTVSGQKKLERDVGKAMRVKFRTIGMQKGKGDFLNEKVQNGENLFDKNYNFRDLKSSKKLNDVRSVVNSMVKSIESNGNIFSFGQYLKRISRVAKEKPKMGKNKQKNNAKINFPRNIKNDDKIDKISLKKSKKISQLINNTHSSSSNRGNHALSKLNNVINPNSIRSGSVQAYLSQLDSQYDLQDGYFCDFEGDNEQTDHFDDEFENEDE